MGETSEANVVPNTAQFDASVKLVLASKLAALGIRATFAAQISHGPLLTIYRLVPDARTRVSEVESLCNDFAIALGCEDVFVARMPGESAIGIFVPNIVRQPVNFRNTINSLYAVTYLKREFPEAPQFTTVDLKRQMNIPISFGVNYLGEPFIEDLTTMPHLLIAGATGSGKSTLLASILAGLIYCIPSSHLRIVLSDTKGVEFGDFAGAPHLIYPIAKTCLQTLDQLDSVIAETNERMKLIAKAGKRNIAEYNLDAVTKLPYILIVIDELADLLQNEEKNGVDEKTIKKLTINKLGQIVQRARAAGVHVIGGLQRPSVDIMRGSVKSNFPARCTFRLPSRHDSQTVISENGAEHLLAQGDMLYASPTKPGLQRLHSPFASHGDLQQAVEVATMREQAR
jgi:S-DNA-T family DNA segregation ATPase FtsK/SpoIIIE